MKVLHKLILSITLFSALALPSVSYGVFYTGNDLKGMLDAAKKVEDGSSSYEEDWEFFKGTGYVAGVADSLQDVAYCPPSSGATLGQFMAIVDKYFSEHPERWAEPASDLVVSALSQAFPCRD